MENISQFAGFWRRVVAYLLDGLIVFTGEVFFLGLPFVIMVVLIKVDRHLFGGPLGLIFYPIGFLIPVLYHSFFESSSKQATPGKMALGIVVTNDTGGRITFWRAFGRNCARFISGFFFGLGYIICAFTARRQAVHDLIASTLVVNQDAPLRIVGAALISTPAPAISTPAISTPVISPPAIDPPTQAAE
jgi:uncharacterized RDD family membrane protein YckC